MLWIFMLCYIIHCTSCIPAAVVFDMYCRKKWSKIQKQRFSQQYLGISVCFISPLWKHVWWKSTMTRSTLTLTSKLMASGKYLQHLGQLKTVIWRHITMHKASPDLRYTTATDWLLSDYWRVEECLFIELMIGNWHSIMFMCGCSGCSGMLFS